MKIGEKIRELREAQNMTRYMLGKKSGVAAWAIAELEDGKRTPHPATVKKIADALHCDYDSLYSLI